MKLIIGEFKNVIGHTKDKSSLKSMAAYFHEMLGTFGVQPTTLDVDTNNMVLEINMTASERKLFISKEENMIKLSPGDKRIKDDGRDFLKSKFLTKEQFKSLKHSLVNGFSAIGIDCTVYLVREDIALPAPAILLVDTKEKINSIDQLDVLQKTYPIKIKGAHEQSKTVNKKQVLDSTVKGI